MDDTLLVPAREIPAPTSVSPQAQKYLNARAQFLRSAGTPPPSPALTDKEGWRRRVEATNKTFDPMIDLMLKSPASVEQTLIDGVVVWIGTPRQMRHPERARLCIHGGGWTLLGGRFVSGDAAQSAADAGCVSYSVDYRMPPDHPFPVGLDDCVAVYREMLKHYDAKNIAISGSSAGGNLTGAVTLKIRDLGLPLPGAIGMMTPVTDLTAQGDTWKTNMGVDCVLGPLDGAIELYADGHDLMDPYLSPLFGDFTKGFSPTFLQSGTRDVLLSDTVRIHQKLLDAGVVAELHVWEALPHGTLGPDAPETLQMRRRFVEFMDKHLG